LKRDEKIFACRRASFSSRHPSGRRSASGRSRSRHAKPRGTADKAAALSRLIYTLRVTTAPRRAAEGTWKVSRNSANKFPGEALSRGRDLSKFQATIKERRVTEARERPRNRDAKFKNVGRERERERERDRRLTSARALLLSNCKRLTLVNRET